VLTQAGFLVISAGGPLFRRGGSGVEIGRGRLRRPGSPISVSISIIAVDNVGGACAALIVLPPILF
jgi:hypothetical protein